MLDELAHTLGYPKFAQRIEQAQTTPATLLARYAASVSIVRPGMTPRVVPDDRDADHVIACAVAARADAIVSGDRHLLELEQHHGIPILTAAQALARSG